MKTVLPWVFAAVFAAGLGWQLTVTQKQRAELLRLHGSAGDAEQLRSETKTQQEHRTQLEAEVQRLRNESKELLRLRNEVVQLQKDKQKLTQDLKASQNQVQAAQSQAVAAQTQAATAQQQADALRAANAAQPVLQANPAVPDAQAAAQEARARFLKRYGLQPGAEIPDTNAPPPEPVNPNPEE